MVNSSPDYAITKSGVRPLSRKRDKPLRTYGRQSTATPEPRSEPPPKRARITYAVHDDKNIKPLGIAVAEDDVRVVTPVFKAKPQPTAEKDQENTPPSKPEPNVPAKRSILNYFKPVTTHLTHIKTAKTNVLSVSETVDEKKSTNEKKPTEGKKLTEGKTKGKKPTEEQQPVEEEMITEEEKTAEEKQTRPLPRPRRRLLRIRSNQSIDSDNEADKAHGHCADDERDESSNAIKEEPRPGRKRRLGGGGSTIRASRRVRRKAASAEVQTTLNISNQAAFSECKLCDTVWNPLYPDDVKYHTKRHAAREKAKKRRGDDF